MGRRLTERQKAARARKKLLAKQQKELGPLFAAQADVPDEGTLLLQRRMRWADMANHLQELLGGSYVLDALTERRLRRLAQEHLPPEAFAALDGYRRGTCPVEPNYGIGFWKDVLTGRRVVWSVHWVDDPQARGGRRLVEDGFWPPEGWVPPFKKEQLQTHWTRCGACRMWHAPGQEVCYEDGGRRDQAQA